MGYQVRIEMLYEFYPARAARCEHGKDSAFGYSFNQLVALFNNG